MAILVWVRFPNMLIPQINPKNWFPEFSPLSMKAMVVPICVRFPNMPIHWINPKILASVGNILGFFIRIDKDMIKRGIITFASICVEIYLKKWFPGQICIDYHVRVYSQPMDYENISLCCKIFQ